MIGLAFKKNMPNKSDMSGPNTFKCYICNALFDKFGLESHVNIDCNFKEVIAPMAEELIEVKNAKTEDKNGNYVPMAVSLKI